MRSPGVSDDAVEYVLCRCAQLEGPQWFGLLTSHDCCARLDFNNKDEAI